MLDCEFIRTRCEFSDITLVLITCAISFSYDRSAAPADRGVIFWRIYDQSYLPPPGISIER